MRFNSREAALLGIPDLPQGAFEHVGDRKIKPQGGGSPPPQQSTSTNYNTNIPEYAKPYVTNMLEATQKQLFDLSGNEITGFKQYQPYSTDPTDYFAGPSSLQRSSYNEAGQMQTPGQFGAASGLTGMAGMGQLGTTGQANMYGGLGTALGAAGAMQAMPAFGAGQQFTQQVTDPRSMSAFMSPYQQAVTDVAKNAAVREAQIANQQANLGAARQGTYGGARQALQQSERERNLLSNLSNIQAQGSQSAFDKAMQAQQFGANLGLQGIQTGLQGIGQGLAGTAQGLQGVGAQQAGFAGAGQAGATLGTLGGAQQQADLARLGFQNQLGQQQQQYQQNIINQQIQDYATAQQYPLMQLGFMSNMLRGLPMQATSVQTYQPQPSFTTQAIAGLGTAAGAARAFGMKEGGKVPGYAGPEGSVVSGMKAKLEALADSPNGVQQVAKIAETSPSMEVRKMATEVIMEKQLEQRAAQQAEQSIMQDEMPRGLAAAPAPVMDTMSAAGGGIIAFANEGQVEEDDDYTKYIANVQRMRERAGITGSPVDPAAKALYEKRLAEVSGRRESDVGLNMIDFFSRMNRPGSTVSAGIAAAGEALPGIAARRKELAAEELAATTGLAGLTQAERADMLGITKEALAMRDKELDRKKAERVAQIGATPRDTDLDKTTTAELARLTAPVEQGGAGLPNNAATRALARRKAIEQTGLALRKVETQETNALTTAMDKDGQLDALKFQLSIASDKKKPEIQQKINQRIEEIRNEIKPAQAAPAPVPAPAPGKADGSGRFPEGTMNNPLPLPSNKEDMQKNKVYQTKRGPATWNGTDFVQK
jgi:hypothetical protein